MKTFIAAALLAVSAPAMADSLTSVLGAIVADTQGSVVVWQP